jgi:diketogulonate reductase-like aldo/keto reductase
MAGSDVPFKESMQAMFEMQKEKMIMHVGVSNVRRVELETAMAMGTIATIENIYGHGQRTSIKLTHEGETRGG